MDNKVFHISLLCSFLFHGALLAIGATQRPSEPFNLQRAQTSLTISHLPESQSHNKIKNNQFRPVQDTEKEKGVITEMASIPVLPKDWVTAEEQYKISAVDGLNKKEKQHRVERIEITDADEEGRKNVIPFNTESGVQMTITPVSGFNPHPEYPYAAVARGYEGKVRLKAHVDTSGNVDGCDIIDSSGYPILDSAALEAVRQWKFHPAEQDGVKQKGIVYIPFDFYLTKNEN